MAQPWGWCRYLTERFGWAESLQARMVFRNPNGLFLWSGSESGKIPGDTECKSDIRDRLFPCLSKRRIWLGTESTRNEVIECTLNQPDSMMRSTISRITLPRPHSF